LSFPAHGYEYPKANGDKLKLELDTRKHRIAVKAVKVVVVKNTIATR
jgi:hypothetical protein